jgi:hypothetical protein
MFLNDILVLYIVKNFSDYNCYQLNIHLDSRLNIQELYCYEFYEIRPVFDAYNICQKATKQIFVLRKLKFILNRNNLNKIYVTYILPLLEYACELWVGCCSRDANKLEVYLIYVLRIKF